MNKQSLGQSELHMVIDKILLGRKRGLKSWQIVQLVYKATGRWYSDATITARMREMKNVKCNLSDNTYKSTKTKKEKVL